MKWFHKNKKEPKEYPHPGVVTALDGHTAVYVVENLAAEAIVIHDLPEFTGITGPLSNLVPAPLREGERRPLVMRRTNQPADALVMANGYAVTGMRTTVIAGSLRGGRDILSVLAGARLACVIHLTARAAARHAGALCASHDEYYEAASAGLFQMYAANVQEAADFTLIAHRIAELSLTPGIVAQDLYQTSHSVQSISMPDAGCVRAFLGVPEDMIDTPTTAQAMLFGDSRRRIPLMLDPDHPAGAGGVQDGDSYFKALAAQRQFFYSHIDTIVDTALQEFGDLTGRWYEKVTGYRHEDAEVLVIAQGAITDRLQEVVDCLRNKDKVKAGVINICMLRPFPGAMVAELLKGRKAVTVLERTDEPLAQDLPLTREIRGAVARAVETDRADYPRIYTGSYGVGTGLPDAGELIAVYRNMLAQENNKPFFYTGIGYRAPDRRFPHLQTLQQQLEKHYPALQQQLLAGTGETPPPVEATTALQIHSLSIQGGLLAGNIFAQNLAHTLKRKIRTFPTGGLEPGLQPASLTMVIGDEEPGGEPEVLDAVLVTAYKLMDNLPLITRIRAQGILIIESNQPPRITWRGLPRVIQEAIRARELHLYTIDGSKIAADTASNPSLVDQLAVWALLGAWLKCAADTSAIDQQVFLDYLRTQLDKILGTDHPLTVDITTVIKVAAEQVSELPWQSFKADQRTSIVEPETPWNVAQAGKGTEPVFDVSRFWQSVGYLYDTGQSGHTLIDPYVATGIMPARSSAFRDISPYRLRIPRWLPENCTGCGKCWALCPESALPPTIQRLSSVIQTAVKHCEQEGMLMTQMNRVGEPLAKQAQKMLAADDLGQYLTLGALLRNALVQLMERLKIEGDNRDDLVQEFKSVCKPLEEFKIARTGMFFTEAEQAAKGSGVLLNIALNPMSCTGCGSCIENCPEQAFVWTEQTVEVLDEYRNNWRLQRTLPQPDTELVSQFIEKDKPETNLNRLLLGNVYHSLVGGDGAIPGNSLKTSVHQLTSTLESIMVPRFENHCRYLDGLITGLEEKIQGKVTGTMNINDFEGFTRRLARLHDKGLSAQDLAALVNEDNIPRSVDTEQLTRLSGLLESLKQTRKHYQEGMTGNDRARMLLAIDPGAASFWNGTYPYNPHSQPWICHLPGAAPLLAEGIFAGITGRLAREIKLNRQAELELKDDYDAAEFEREHKEFGWQDFTSEEQRLIPPVLVLCRAETTGGATLSRLLSGPYPMKVVMLNNEGIVIPGSLVLWEKEADLLALMHAGAYVLQTTAANPEHMITGITEAVEHDGPVLLHIYAPHPQASEIAPDMVMKQATLASHSRVFPLFRIKPGTGGAAITLEGNDEPDGDWVMRELPYVEPSTAKSSITVPFTTAHWAIREPRFQEHFRILPMGHVSDKLKPLVEYIDLDPDQRQQFDPYIDYIDARQRRYIAIVSGAMVKATEDTRELWRYLQTLAKGPPVEIPDQKPAATVPEETTAPAPDLSAYEHLTERLLALCGYSQDPDFFNQSLREFITRNDT